MRRNRHLHPGADKLEAWLDGDAPQLDAHIDQCLRCSNRIEELAGDDYRTLVQALGRAVAPPRNLQPRLVDGISRRMQAREDLTLLGDLVGVSWRTLRVLSQGPDINE